MCGILGKINKSGKPVNGSIIYNYIQQRNRGTQGFGFAYQDRNSVVMRHNIGEAGIIKELNRYKSNAILFHHRIPTSTANVVRGCHPFKVTIGGRSLFVIHNGVLRNEDELFDTHVAKGYTYRSYSDKTKDFNDSEALAHDLAEVILTGKSTIKAEGSIAFIAFESDKNNNLIKMHFGHNAGSPLKIVKNKQSILVGSEVEGEDVGYHQLYTYNLKSDSLTQKYMYIPFAIGNNAALAQGYSKPWAHAGETYDDWDLRRGTTTIKTPASPDCRQSALPLVSENPNWLKAGEVITLPSPIPLIKIGDAALFVLSSLSDEELEMELEETGYEIMALEAIDPKVISEDEIEALSEWHEYYTELSYEKDYRDSIADIEEEPLIYLPEGGTAHSY